MLLVALAPMARAGAGTIGSPISDFAADTNGNGLYEYLILSIPIQVSQAGGFELSVSLYDSSMITLITSISYYFYLDSSTTFYAQLDGKAISGSGLDGPYHAYIDLYNTDGAGSDLDWTVYTTNAYLAAEFETSVLSFAPPHSDSAIDLNGNGLYDLLQVQVNVNASVAGDYIIQGSIQDPTYTYLDYATTTVSLPVGLSQVLLNYSGFGIRAAGVDGPYFVYLYAYDVAYALLATDTHTTQAYSAASFEEPPGALAPPYSDHGLDTDGDGLFNAIALEVPISVSAAATFDLSIMVAGPGGTPYLGGDWKTATLPVGTQTVELDPSTIPMVSEHVDGPYQVTIGLSVVDPNTGSQVPIGTDSYVTADYTVDQFDGVPAKLVPPFSDRAIDRDVPADGLYDVLAVNVTVNVTESGPYMVDANLIDPNFNFLDYDDMFVPAGVGNFTITLNFPGVDIRNDGVSGAFGVNIYLYTFVDSSYLMIDSASYTTAVYNAGDFAYANPALLDGYLYDAASGTPLPNTQVEAFNYRWLKEVFTWTDGTGYYAFPVEEGTWVVTPEPYEGNNQAVGEVNVTAPGASLDFDLPTLVPQMAYVNLSLSDWSHAERDRAWIFTYLGDTARQYYDWWFGNRDEYLTNAEFNASLAWPSAVPDPLSPQSADLFQIDNSSFDLVPGSNSYGTGEVEGTIFDPRPMTGLETGAFTNSSAVAPGRTHTIEMNVSYDLIWNNRTYEVSLPAGYLAQSVLAPPEFFISGLGTQNVTIDPPLPADPNNTTAFAWVTIVAWASDVTPPEISAVATTPATPELGASATMSASVSDASGVQAVMVELTDPDGVVVGNFTMDLVGGNYQYVFTPSLSGTYTYALYALDTVGNGATFAGSFEVVDTTPPAFASATASPSPQEIGGTIVFSAKMSDLSGVQSATVEVHGPTGSLLGNFTMAYSASTDLWTATRTFNVPGTYAYKVWATDGAGNVGSSSGSFVMRDTTGPTLSGATATPDPVEIHGNVAFAVTATDLGGVASAKVEIRDAQGHLVGNYTMTAGSADTYTYSFAPPDLGTYSYRISAFDTSGNGRMVSGTFVVQDTTDPVASAGSDQTVVQGTQVTFNASASTDNAAVSTYTWTFNDGGAQTLTGVSPTYTFANVGTFTVTLTVADTSGNTATDTMTVTVTSLPPTTGSVSGTVSDASGVAIQGATVDLMSGSTKVATATTDAQGHFSFTNVNAGTYTLQVQATGYDPGSAQVSVVAGQTATSTVHLTVTATTPPQGGVDWLPILVIVVVVAAAAAGAFLYLRRRKA